MAGSRCAADFVVSELKKLLAVAWQMEVQHLRKVTEPRYVKSLQSVSSRTLKAWPSRRGIQISVREADDFLREFFFSIIYRVKDAYSLVLTQLYL
jgi:hypothetical protein